MNLSQPIPREIGRWLAAGWGVGIEMAGPSLEIAVVRVLPWRVRVAARHTIADFASRPAAEWGAEYSKILSSLGIGHLTATVLLPRPDVIVRHLALPGVAWRDRESAIRYQLESLHPYGDEEICHGWAPAGPGSALVGIARRAVVERYVKLFSEAGIAVSCFTFSAAAMYSAIRLGGAADGGGGFVASLQPPGGGVELYGESPSKPVFSAEFEMPPERALSLALAEMRLDPATAPRAFASLLPKPSVNPVTNDLARDPRPYATALSAACGLVAPVVNVLPADLRRSSSRVLFVPTVVLASLLVLLGVGANVYDKYSERQYLGQLNAEIARLTPLAQRADVLDADLQHLRARSQLLDKFRAGTHADLDALNELTRLIESPAWTSAIDLTRDQVRISGEAPQAAPLIRILDSSAQFENSVIDANPRSGSGEMFQIHAARGKRQ